MRSRSNADEAGATWPWLLATALVLGLVAWRVIGLGMAAQQARHQPEAATAWRADLAHVQRRLALRAAARSEPAQARAHARQAIASSPLDGRAYAALARAGDAPEVALMIIASQRWPLDVAAHAVLADHHLRDGAPERALEHLDALLRIRPAAREQIFPLLFDMLTRMPDPTPMAVWLGEGRAWRATFIAEAARRLDEAAVLHGLLHALRDAPVPPTEAEHGALLMRLERDRRYTDLWFAWIAGLPPERLHALANVQNGSFEWPTSGAGFDWRFGRVPGASIEQALDGAAEGGTALRVSFRHQRVDFRHVSQLLLLPPGQWRLSGKVRLDALRNEFGLAWQVSCAVGRTPLGESEAFRGASPWRAFRFDFEVPEDGCPAQWLRLTTRARAAADRFIGGEAWFDALAIRRLPAAP